jgi:hypothetical protein
VARYKTYILDGKITDIWDDFITKSQNGTIFHKLGWLKVLEDHAKMRFIPVAVNKGNSIVCLFPLFIKKMYGFRIVLSPPNSCGIPFLGPILNIPAKNRYNYENSYAEIIDEIILFAEKKIGFDYIRIIQTPELSDMRPYTWSNYYVQPGYTYKFDLTRGTADIYEIFHSSTKNAMMKALRKENLLISNDLKYIHDIRSLVAKRYEDQNKKFRISENYLRNLLGTSVSANIESIAIINNRCTVAGDITLTDRNRAYAWIGTVSRNENIPGAGELLLWNKITEYKQRGLSEYDFVGANTRHICKHKAKYGARLVPYFTAHKTSLKGKIALRLLRGSESDFFQ